MKNQPNTIPALLIEKEIISRLDLGSIVYAEPDLIDSQFLPEAKNNSLTITATSISI